MTGTDHPAERFEALFGLIDDAVVEVEVADMRPVVRAVNPGFESVFGWSAETVVGESLNDFIVPDGRVEEAVDLDRRTADGKVNSETVTRRTADGLRQFIYRGIPYERDDGGRGGLAIYTDITERNRRKRHHAVLHRVLRHNLRNALTVILGSASEIERRADDPLVEQARLTLSAAEDLERLSDRARLVERAFDDEVDRQVVDVAALSRSVATAAREAADSATITTELPDRLPALAGGPIEAALENLLSNAVIHGGESPAVRIVGRRAGDAVEVEVVDDGPGIPDGERAVVFEDRPLTQLSHGTGLGLWLAKWAVESCHGRIDHERTDGETVVRVTLPAADAK
ncbi:PAS domain-containing sensor histidine kinase [Halosimplex rubrum]|uniref:histidine kinase n=1 Tax=Halosimplex rubrum TaxID=869889 RepID=A0A7D5TM93_9EURY|nr:PAS domain-containing sensor histidine kinase [Halosimplex rubrum]QLH76474.1 PAS domain-containing sensor histidine kinase [Halosimplex rubrum]